MSLREKYLKVLLGMAPAGAAGVSLLLGSVSLAAASQEPAGQQPKTAQAAGVSERLAAIRDAVSTAAQHNAAKNDEIGRLRLAWGNWWRNWGWARPWGWGWPNWNNWHNWNNWPNWWRNW